MWDFRSVKLIIVDIEANPLYVGKQMKSNHYRCRNCDNACHRHGKIKNKQRWKCSVCGLTQFRVYRRCIFTADRKTIIKRLNRENVGIRGMARLMGLSPTHIV